MSFDVFRSYQFSQVIYNMSFLAGLFSVAAFFLALFVMYYTDMMGVGKNMDQLKCNLQYGGEECKAPTDTEGNPIDVGEDGQANRSGTRTQMLTTTEIDGVKIPLSRPWDETRGLAMFYSKEIGPEGDHAWRYTCRAAAPVHIFS